MSANDFIYADPDVSRKWSTVDTDVIYMVQRKCLACGTQIVVPSDLHGCVLLCEEHRAADGATVRALVEARKRR